MASLETETWPQEIFQVLTKNRVQQVAYIPDIGHASLIKMCHKSANMKTVVLSTEEEGVALLAGAWLGGDRGVLLMQSSGVGNCINMLSLTRVCRMPLLILVTMRGERDEFNPWQVPMGQHANQVLKAAGVLTFKVNDKNRIKEAVEAAAKMAFEGPAATAVLISQRVLGVKTFDR